MDPIQPGIQPHPHASKDKDRPDAEWTVLVYGAGDNNLDRYNVSEYRDIEASGMPPGVNFVLQWDRGKYKETPLWPWQGCKRFLLRHGSPGFEELQDLGQVNMASPRNLSDFVAWGMKQYPARHTMVVIKDHGHAWNGVIDDDSDKNPMSLTDLEKALQTAEKETGKKPGILAFDACGMANTEVLMELADRATYLVASEKVMYAPAFPYQETLSGGELFKISPRDLASRLVEESKKRPKEVDNLTAFDLSRVDDFTKALDAFSDEVSLDKEDHQAIRAVLTKEDLAFPGSSDLPRILKEVATSPAVRSSRLKKKANEALDALNGMIVNEQHNPELPIGGVSVPSYYSIFTEAFFGTELARRTDWDEALQDVTDPIARIVSGLQRLSHNLKELI